MNYTIPKEEVEEGKNKFGFPIDKIAFQLGIDFSESQYTPILQKKDDALKLALEALEEVERDLEYCQEHSKTLYNKQRFDITLSGLQSAIIAIKDILGLHVSENKIKIDGCNFCRNNVGVKEGGLYCINNCVSGSKFIPKNKKALQDLSSAWWNELSPKNKTEIAWQMYHTTPSKMSSKRILEAYKYDSSL